MGRPKKNQGLAGAPVVALSEGPPESGRKKRSISDLLKFAREYEDKTAIAFYLYRLWPVIDLNLVGRKTSYIDKLMSPEECETDKLTQKWGRGKYKLCMTDSNIKGGARLCEATFEIDHPDFEPASEWNWRELDLGSPANASFVQSLRLRGMLPKDGEEGIMQDTNNAAAVNALTQLVRDVLSREKSSGPDAYAVGLQIAEKIADKPAQDPMALALRMVEVMNQAKPDTSALDAVRAELAELKRANSGDSMLDQFKKFRELERAIGGRGGGGGGGGMPEWVSELLKAAAPALLALFMRGGGPPMAPAPAGPGPLAGAPPLFPPAVPMAPADASEGDAMFRLIQTAHKALRAFRGGMSGDDFAHSLVTLEDDGEGLYSTLYQMGADNILAALKSAPQWGEIAGRESEVREFLGAFIEYGRPEAPEAPAPPSAAPPAAGLVVEVPK